MRGIFEAASLLSTLSLHQVVSTFLPLTIYLSISPMPGRSGRRSKEVDYAKVRITEYEKRLRH
jgi:hypothetical protein